MRRAPHLAALLAAALAPGPLLPQAGPPAREPGVTGSLGSAARDTIGVGQTKPPGAALGSDGEITPALRERDRALQRSIDTGICAGCDD
ncbi:hypothetical protein [Methylobacterium nonmethylotrophicum]|uniref:Uncharacterized protein n=1 Tax=Methylobacterium nonmethylotrophicum TaxID=1141884 RepID=A0A4Z0NSM5_9HYPH|nr:hypothetical protein [Methylobacterium nonmethylotrophicum]TGE00088.1 hypothetical protein EU555_09210 [Methylobacterium nonmethylotrophicum]